MRFFHKFGSINFRFLGLVNGILLKTTKKIKYTKALNYFEKYAYAVNDIKIKKSSDEHINKIWQLWLQGEENMPQIVKICHSSVKKFYGDRVVLLDKNSLNKYIELPDYIEEKYKKGIISHANYSDIIRLSLLAKYGGCWIDSTIYLTDVIPNEIFAADFFSFKSVESENLKFINSLEQFKVYSNHINKIIDIESPYFLASKPGNILINAVLNLFLEYWKYEDKLVDYLMIDKMFAIAVICNSECNRQFKNMPSYYLENVLLLQNALFEKFDENLFNNIKLMSSVHKLTHKTLHRNPYKNSFLNKLLDSKMEDK